MGCNNTIECKDRPHGGIRAPATRRRPEEVYRRASSLSELRESIPIDGDGVYCPICHIANIDLGKLRTPCPRCGRGLLNLAGREAGRAQGSSEGGRFSSTAGGRARSLLRSATEGSRGCLIVGTILFTLRAIGNHLRVAFSERGYGFTVYPRRSGIRRTKSNTQRFSNATTPYWGAGAAGSQVVLVTTGYSGSPEPSRSYQAVIDFDPGAVPWRSVEMHHDDGFRRAELLAHVRRVWNWRPGAFDALVRQVADDAVANVLVVALDCRWVLPVRRRHGCDCRFSGDSARSLRDKHPFWLSARADGL